MALSCSHGANLDPLAADAAVKLRQRWKPDTLVHLGDWIDTSCWRKGAQGTPDESADPEADMNAGLKFLRELKPTHLTPGNHDIRPLHFIDHKDARIAHAASKCIQYIDTEFRRMGIKTLKTWDVWNQFEFGGVKYTHGFKFNVNAARDTAIAMGQTVVFGHTHKVMQQHVDSLREHYGICVGALCQFRNMDYAAARASTLGWSQGMVFGEYTEDRKPESKLWLIDNGRNDARETWRLPV